MMILQSGQSCRAVNKCYRLIASAMSAVPILPPWEGDQIASRSIGAADALQVPIVGFAAFENHFCGHEQQCAGIYRGTFSTDNPLKFSQEVRFCGRHGRIVELKVEDIKITGEYYRRSGFCPLTRMCTSPLSSSCTGHAARRLRSISDNALISNSCHSGSCRSLA